MACDNMHTYIHMCKLTGFVEGGMVIVLIFNIPLSANDSSNLQEVVKTYNGVLKCAQHITRDHQLLIVTFISARMCVSVRLCVYA